MDSSNGYLKERFCEPYTRVGSLRTRLGSVQSDDSGGFVKKQTVQLLAFALLSSKTKFGARVSSIVTVDLRSQICKKRASCNLLRSKSQKLPGCQLSIPYRPLELRGQFVASASFG